MDPDKIALISTLIWPIAIVAGTISLGWVATTWLRIRNGYPLDGAWGQAVYPKTDAEAAERVKLVTQENAQLRAELGSVKDRLANVERIVTDSAHGLNIEIEQLRDGSVN